MIHGAPVYRLRGNLLPLVYLNRRAASVERQDAPRTRRPVNIVVLQADDRQFGLVVDEINDTEEIVVKPLGKQLKGIACFAGATIMGDGQVALILDVLGIAQMANVVTEVRERAVMDTSAGGGRSHVAGRDRGCYSRSAENRRMAIPLSMVARLEEFPADEGGRTRDSDRSCSIAGRSCRWWMSRRSRARPSGADRRQTLQVVVYSRQGRSVGLVVDRILDIVEEACRLGAAGQQRARSARR